MIQIPSTPIPGKSGSQFTVMQVLQFTVLLSFILYFGRTLFIPLSFAMLISFTLYPVCTWMEKKGINKSIAIIISMLTLSFMVVAIIYLMIIQFSSFVEEWPEFKFKLIETVNQISMYVTGHFNISLNQQKDWLKNIIGSSGSQVLPFLGTTAYSFSVSAVVIILIPIIASLMLYYRQMFVKVLYAVFPDDKKESVREVLHETIHAYYNFIKGMCLVYLIVGILNSAGLALIGVPHPVLFGFIASILTFIPYVGIMIASLLPVAVSWITFNSPWYPLGVILVFTIVQYLEANVIFPFAVSSRMHINTFVTIVAIITGGILWGAAGMILFVPFAGIVKLIADRTDSLKVLSMLLGTTEKKSASSE